MGYCLLSVEVKSFFCFANMILIKLMIESTGSVFGMPWGYISFLSSSQPLFGTALILPYSQLFSMDMCMVSFKVTEAGDEEIHCLLVCINWLQIWLSTMMKRPRKRDGSVAYRFSKLRLWFLTFSMQTIPSFLCKAALICSEYHCSSSAVLRHAQA